jgi:hypothetical protein
MMHLYRDGLFDVVFIHKDDCFFPVWVLKNGGSFLLEIDPGQTTFKQSLYLDTILRLMDCFLFKMQEGFLSMRTVSECMKRLVRDSSIISLYREDLEKLGILIQEGERIRFIDDFLFKDYAWRVRHLEKLLDEEGKAVTEIVKNNQYCTRLYLISSMMRKVVKRTFFAQGELYKIVLKDEMMRFLNIIEKLLFRGFLIEDLSSQVVAYNSFGVTMPPSNSLVVNPDFEIIVYNGKFPFYSFYILAGFSRLLAMNELIRFKIDRNTLWYGMAYIGDVDVLIKLLEKASKYPLSDDMISLLKGWVDGFVSVKLEKRWLVRVDNDDDKLRLYQNRWIRANVEETGEMNLILRNGVDINRFIKELRRESIYIELTGNEGQIEQTER